MKAQHHSIHELQSLLMKRVYPTIIDLMNHLGIDAVEIPNHQEDTYSNRIIECDGTMKRYSHDVNNFHIIGNVILDKRCPTYMFAQTTPDGFGKYESYAKRIIDKYDELQYKYNSIRSVIGIVYEKFPINTRIVITEKKS